MNEVIPIQKFVKESFFYATQADKEKIIKIEVWCRNTPVISDYGPGTAREQEGVSSHRYYRTENGLTVKECNDHFIIPEMNNIELRRLSDVEINIAGLA